jgi:hypothetical protein
MNHDQYNTFLKYRKELDSLVMEFGKLFIKFDNRKQDKGFDWDSWEFNDDYFSMKWYWHGPYGAEDFGYEENIPITLLFTSEEWEKYIRQRITSEKEEIKNKGIEAAEKVRQGEIAQAKAILRREGFSCT